MFKKTLANAILALGLIIAFPLVGAHPLDVQAAETRATEVEADLAHPTRTPSSGPIMAGGWL